MLRLLLVAVLVYAVVTVLRHAWHAYSLPTSPRPRRVTREGRMVRCAACALYVPEDEAIRDGASFYCCEAHRHLGQGPAAGA